MSFEQWSRNGWLKRHEPTVAEVLQLFQVADREISDAQAQGLSADGRFMHAYDAALLLCALALAASGYMVPKGPSKHKHTIDSLRYSLGRKWADAADYLERCSRKRGQAFYERTGVVSYEEAEELLDTARQLRTDVLAWLKANHPALVPPGT